MVREEFCKGLGAGLGLQDKAQANFNDFNNTMNRPGFAVHIALGTSNAAYARVNQ